MKYEDLFNSDDRFDNEPWWNTDAYYNNAKDKKPFHLESKHANNDAWLSIDKFRGSGKNDVVNSPSHYTHGRYEAIDVIEDSISGAPDVKAGFLLGQVLKYLLRLWHKKNAKQDAEKARWYLNRLIDYLT